MSDYLKVHDWVAPELRQDFAYKALCDSFHMFGVVEKCVFRISHQYLSQKLLVEHFQVRYVLPPVWIFFCVQFGEKTVPQIVIASHFIILIFHHQNCEKMGSTHVNPSSQTMPGGLKLRTPSPNPSSYSLFNIEKPLVLGPRKSEKNNRAKQQWPSRDSAVDWNPKSNHWARNPPDLELSSWDWGRGYFWAVSATPAVFHPIPPMKYWLIQRYS